MPNTSKKETTKKTTKDQQYFYGTGRRKTAVAQVRLYPDKSDVKINGEKSKLGYESKKPLEAVGKLSDFGVSIKVQGGGVSSQEEAISLGIARALERYNPEFRTALKKAGLLRRDPRMKERKKPGRKKARKSPQWSKR